MAVANVALLVSEIIPTRASSNALLTYSCSLNLARVRSPFVLVSSESELDLREHSVATTVSVLVSRPKSRMDLCSRFFNTDSRAAELLVELFEVAKETLIINCISWRKLSANALAQVMTELLELLLLTLTFLLQLQCFDWFPVIIISTSYLSLLSKIRAQGGLNQTAGYLSRLIFRSSFY